MELQRGQSIAVNKHRGGHCLSWIDALRRQLPLGPYLYPRLDTDQRFSPSSWLLAELIREQVLTHTAQGGCPIPVCAGGAGSALKTGKSATPLLGHVLVERIPSQKGRS